MQGGFICLELLKGFFFLLGLICPIELISFSLLNSGMDQELAEGYQGKFKELKVLVAVVCLYFMVYLNVEFYPNF